ncbi:MAG TPA: oligopeptide/dipeptide ABC transporter ATP-binding protein, partial [Bacillota bacterium]
APVNELFAEPLHPYTQGLLNSIPRLSEKRERLYVIDGMVPDLSAVPRGCAFHPRCPQAGPRCRRERPELTDEPGGRQIACWLREGGVA